MDFFWRLVANLLTNIMAIAVAEQQWQNVQMKFELKHIYHDILTNKVQLKSIQYL